MTGIWARRLTFAGGDDMTLSEALEYLQYGNWYYQVQKGINKAEYVKLGEAIAEVCEVLRFIKFKVEDEE